jgi:glutaredoxin
MRKERAPQVLEKQDFKRREWLLCASKKELENLIEHYTRTFPTVIVSGKDVFEELVRWDLDKIHHFFEIYQYLYKGRYPEEHHIRLVATIIEELGL